MNNSAYQNLALESLVVDDMALKSFIGLEVVPVDILKQGTKKIVQFMLDLFRSPDADPLYRCKLMVVGFAEIGKSSLLDCLFPMSGEMMLVEDEGSSWMPYFFVLRGNVLAWYPRGLSAEEAFAAQPINSLRLTREWRVEPKEEFGEFGMVLSSPSGQVHVLFAVAGMPINEWMARIIEIQDRNRTHGIDIKEVIISDPNTREYFKSRENGKLEVSVWDFAGQHDYYNNHHHFLTARSLFLVLWNASEHGREGVPNSASPQGRGLDSLRFWFASLAFHLTQKNSAPDEERKKTADYFSLVVVGTHVDRLDDRQRESGQAEAREAEVRRVAAEFGLVVRQYLEVSCVNELTNIGRLQSIVTSEILELKCMGERVPRSYLAIERLVQDLRLKHQKYPVVRIEEFYEKFNNELLVRRALSLLSMWGRCVYFEADATLSLMLVLDPHFLSKLTLAGLFRLGEEARRRFGVIHHQDLAFFWPKLAERSDFEEISPVLIDLMEKFDVCFGVAGDETKPFAERRSVLPCLLPLSLSAREMAQEMEVQRQKQQCCQDDVDIYHSKHASMKAVVDAGFANAAGQAKLRELEKNLHHAQTIYREVVERHSELQLQHSRWRIHWPDITPPAQNCSFERVFHFGAVPAELVSRVIARLHGLILDNCVFRNLVLLQYQDALCRVTIDTTLDRFAIEVRCGNMEDGLELLSLVKRCLSESLAGISEASGAPKVVIEGIRSPFSDTIISLDAFASTAEASVSGGSDPLLSVRFLQQRAGLAPQEDVHRRPVERGTEEWQELEELFILMGGDPAQIGQAYNVDNPQATRVFETYREELVVSPQLQADTQSLANPSLGKTYLDLLEQKIRAYPRSNIEGLAASALPMAYGTTEGMAWKIASHGFGATGAQISGYYGKGVYFTSRVSHACEYSRSHSGAVLVLALVIPGNVYPFTESPTEGHSAGGQCKAGYHSHYTVVGDGYLPSTAVLADSHDDLVVFQAAQALAKFIVILTS